MPTVVDLTESPARAPWRSLLAWTAAVVVYAIVLSLEVGISFPYALESSAAYLYALMLLMIPASRLSWRWLSEHRSTVSLAVRHAALATATVALWGAYNLARDRALIGPRYWSVVYAKKWMFQLLFDVAAYGTAMGVIMAAQFRRRDLARERREAELVLAAREAELGAIRAQFQPHFVLNALTSMLALIDRDPALARTMVVRLADLMKAVFDRVDVPAVPLERELDLARAYLDIERIRFGARLQVAFDIEDGARGALVPPFLLQPLVENAIKHGIAPFARPGEVRVRANIAGHRLRIVVSDSGDGSSASAAPGTGRGLELTRRRLDSLYGDGYEMTFDRQPAGTAVRLDLPLGTSHAA